MIGQRKKGNQRRKNSASISSDSSSEEEGNKNQKAQIRNNTKQSTKLDFTTTVREVGETMTQRTDGDLPGGWQRKDNLLKETPPTPKAG